MTEVSKSLNKAIIESLTGKYTLYLFQIASLAVLSRLFTPEIFGLLAALQVLILFFQLIANSGLAPAIVNLTQVPQQLRDGLFSCTLILGGALGLILLAGAAVALEWMGLGADNIDFITFVLVVVVIFSSLSMMPMGSLQKDRKFIRIAQSEVVAESIAMALCLLLYSLGYTIVALTAKLACVSLFRFVFYYLFCKNTTIGRPRFGRQLSSIKVVFPFIKYQFLFNVLNFLSRNLDTILVTKYFGVAATGLYDKSYQVMRYPLQLFTFAITPALQPVLTNYKNQPHIVESQFYRIALKLALLGIFVAIILYWNSVDILFIMFGDQWFYAAPILSVLAVSIPLQMVLSMTGGIYQAMGNTKLLFVCGLFSSVVNVAAILLGILSGNLMTLCMYLILALVINFFQCFYVLHRYIFMSRPSLKHRIVFTLVLLPYFNLIFDISSQAQSLSYKDAFISIATNAVPLSVLFALIFMIFKYGRNRPKPSHAKAVD